MINKPEREPGAGPENRPEITSSYEFKNLKGRSVLVFPRSHYRDSNTTSGDFVKIPVNENEIGNYDTNHGVLSYVKEGVNGDPIKFVIPIDPEEDYINTLENAGFERGYVNIPHFTSNTSLFKNKFNPRRKLPRGESLDKYIDRDQTRRIGRLFSEHETRNRVRQMRELEDLDSDD